MCLFRNKKQDYEKKILLKIIEDSLSHTKRISITVSTEN